MYGWPIQLDIDVHSHVISYVVDIIFLVVISISVVTTLLAITYFSSYTYLEDAQDFR